ncbi:hypothetical protein HN873_057080 [Arachis hypogaea]
MDRSKSRTDLLAAGKKRLQQFRQKKDGKGGSSRGKSKKSDKNLIPEDDTDGQSSPSMSTTSSQVTDGNVETDNESNAVSAELLESQSSPNSLTLDNLDPSADSSPLAIINTIDEETELDSGRKSSLAVQEGHEVDSELSSQDQGKRAEYVGADVAEDVSLRTSDDQKDLESDRRPGAEAQEIAWVLKVDQLMIMSLHLPLLQLQSASLFQSQQRVIAGKYPCFYLKIRPLHP